MHSSLRAFASCPRERAVPLSITRPRPPPSGDAAPMIEPTPRIAGSVAPGEARRPWLAPRVDELPRLTELTLATGGGVPGDCDLVGGGSTCF